MNIILIKLRRIDCRGCWRQVLIFIFNYLEVIENEERWIVYDDE